MSMATGIGNFKTTSSTKQKLWTKTGRNDSALKMDLTIYLLFVL